MIAAIALAMLSGTVRVFAAEGDHIVINEIQIAGKGSASRDFIELYNPTGKRINLRGYRLVKRTKNGASDTTIKSWTTDAFIASQDHFLWANSKDGFAEGLEADAATTQTIAKDNAVALRKGSEDTGEIIDAVAWGENESGLAEGSPYPDNPGEDKSIERSGFADTDDNSLDFFLSDKPSPTSSAGSANEGSYDEEGDSRSECDPNVRLNELLPNPKDEKTEYIELANRGSEKIGLSGWMLRDSSKTGEYAFPDGSVIPGHGFVVIRRSDFKFALNNSKESVRLLCPDGSETDSVSYEKAKEEISYGLESNGQWRWSSHQTPGKENRFDKRPKAELKVGKETYVHAYIQFEAALKNSKRYRFRWDFGDQHKSYLAKPRHRYEKPGTYQITLLIRGKSEDIELRKKIRVTEYPERKVSLTAFCPNPEGKDTENEWVEIRNDSGKKLDLSGWSLASGSKKLFNHPLLEKITIAPKETFRLTRTHANFALNNKKGQLELRYPDGSKADSVDYDHGKKAASENETYAKIDGKWKWIVPIKDEPIEDVPERMANGKQTERKTPMDLPTESSIETAFLIGKSSFRKTPLLLPDCLVVFDGRSGVIRDFLSRRGSAVLSDAGSRYLFTRPLRIIPLGKRLSPFGFSEINLQANRLADYLRSISLK